MLFHFSHSLSKLPKTGYKKRPHLPHRAWRRRYKTAVPLRFVTFGSPLFCCPNGALRRPLHQNTACPAHGNGGCRRQLLRQSRFTAHAAGGTSQPRCRGALTAMPFGTTRPLCQPVWLLLYPVWALCSAHAFCLLLLIISALPHRVKPCLRPCRTGFNFKLRPCGEGPRTTARHAPARRVALPLPRCGRLLTGHKKIKMPCRKPQQGIGLKGPSFL